MKITKRTLDQLAKPERDTVLWDDALRGFGVRLSPGGVITFLVQYRNAQGRSRRITIGPYGAYSPAKAREEAETLLHSAKVARKGLGRDPADTIQAERDAITFKELAAEYMRKAAQGLILVNRGAGRRPKKASTIAIDAYRMAHLTGHFGNKPVKNITRGDASACLEMLITGRHGAGRTLGLLGAVFTYAVAQGYMITNPVRGIHRPTDGRRQFRLDREGYRKVGKALEAAQERGENWRAITAIKLLALTGCRKSEILKLQMSEIDIQGRCLRLGDTKTGASMRVLGEAAVSVLRAALNHPGRPASPFLLPGRDPREAYNGLGGEWGGAWQRIFADAGLGDGFTVHSLRHAFASAADEIGMSELSISLLMGHASGKQGITRGYIHRPDQMLLAEADRVCAFIWEALVGQSSPAAEVVELRPQPQVA